MRNTIVFTLFLIFVTVTFSSISFFIGWLGLSPQFLILVGILMVFILFLILYHFKNVLKRGEENGK